MLCLGREHSHSEAQRIPAGETPDVHVSLHRRGRSKKKSRESREIWLVDFVNDIHTI
jgi:hypothetical protein